MDDSLFLYMVISSSTESTSVISIYVGRPVSNSSSVVGYDVGDFELLVGLWVGFDGLNVLGSCVYVGTWVGFHEGSRVGLWTTGLFGLTVGNAGFELLGTPVGFNVGFIVGLEVVWDILGARDGVLEGLVVGRDEILGFVVGFDVVWEDLLGAYDGDMEGLVVGFFVTVALSTQTS